MTDNKLLLAIYNDVQSMKDDLETVKGDLETVKGDLGTVKGDLETVKGDLETVKDDLETVKDDLETAKDDLETVKRDVKHLKQKTINMQAMDEAILDEVERVHGSIKTLQKISFSIFSASLYTILSQTKSKKKAWQTL